MSVVVLSDMLIKLKNQIIRDNYLVFSKIYEMERFKRLFAKKSPIFRSVPPTFC